MKPVVGYLLNTKDGLAGEPGLFYDYILAGNGLFVRALKTIWFAFTIGQAFERAMIMEDKQQDEG